MATYKEIQGEAVVNTSADITSEGQVFYNTPGNAFKVATATASDAFANGGNLGTGRYSRAHFGTQTSAVFAGGSPPNTTQGSEHYDGSSWTAGGNMNVSRRNLTGGGVLTAGVAFGGITGPGYPSGAVIVASTEHYNGSSWTNATNMPTATRGQQGTGTQTAAFACGGSVAPGASPAGASKVDTFEYDGSNWTTGGNLGHGRSDGQASGTLTAGLVVGGRETLPPYPATPAADTVEEYDGTSWTAGGAYPTAMNAVGNAGTQTASLVCGGNTGGNQSASNLYNGTSFSSSATLNTGRGYLSGCGTQAAGLFAGGGVPPYQQTEEFTIGGTPSVETIDVT